MALPVAPFSLMQRRTFLAFYGAALLGMPALGQVRDLNDAINKAGRQRMLSQRTAKAYLAQALQAQTQQAARIMDESMARFDRQLVELKAFAPSPAIRDTYLQLEAAWAVYKERLVGKMPSVAGAEAVAKQSNVVLALAHKGTGQLEQASGAPVGHLVNVAGRQRMLSQRLAAYCYAVAAKVNTEASLAEIQKARYEFLAGMRELRSAPQATEQIKRELQLGEEQWVFFDSALQRAQAGAMSKESLSYVFVSSENLLSVMDKVTGLYAALG